MDVTDVLRDRMGEPSGLQWMTAVSIAAHVVVFAAFMLVPGALAVAPAQRTGECHDDHARRRRRRPAERRHDADERPAGAGRSASRRAARTSPAAGGGDSADDGADARGAKRLSAASAAVKQAPDEARGRTPTRGAQTSPGNAVAVTGARGEGFGLSSGGGPGVQGTLDVGNFCCPDYLVTMVTRIKATGAKSRTSPGLAVVKFTIRRDGVLENIELERSSNYPIADLAAQRAVILTKQLPPLPDAFPNPTL